MTLAPRMLLPSSAISPKNEPSPSATFLPGKSTSTSPAAMKYMQSPFWPLRMIMVRAGRSMVRSMWVTSAIAAGPSGAKNGTLLTDLPGLQEIVAAGLGGKAGRQNTGPQPEHAQPGDHHQRGDQAGRAA